MLRSRKFGRFCAIVMAFSFLLTGVFVYAAQNGMIEQASAEGYSKRLFDASRVHSIDIVMSDWEDFLANCTDEEYVSCTVLIDGEKYSNVAIRAKGNTSLSSVQQYGNDRYSLKLEFDHYDSAQTYYGLDKLCLNNLIQDKTMMKDYIAYTLMGRMGVASPECSYVWITVNGSDWGLYLAVEGVEDAFLLRNYGSDSGNLYKPDSQSNGGGRGNGRDFDFANFNFDFADSADELVSEAADSDKSADSSGLPEPPNADSSDFPTPPNSDQGADSSDRHERPNRDFSGKQGGFSSGGMGSSDVKLQYIDDDASSYSNIFDSAKTKIDSDDQARLIESLKALSEGDASVVNTNSVMRYLAVHDFLVNGDSYTGSMVHNYYLYEKDGVLEMIPWDYNLAFGAFSFGSSSAASAVNSPIDSPVSGDVGDRPMVAWIFENETYLAKYHAIYAEFIENNLANGWLSAEIERVYQMIRPYAEKAPTAFYTADELDQAVTTLQTFCQRRAESIQGQLDGTIPSTESGQAADAANLIDASNVNLSDMGEFNQGGGGFGGNTPPEMPNEFNGTAPDMPNSEVDSSEKASMPNEFDGTAPSMPEGETDSSEKVSMPNGLDGTAPSMPNGEADSSEKVSMPNGLDGTAPSMPNGEADSSEKASMPNEFDGTAPSMPSGESDSSENANSESGTENDSAPSPNAEGSSDPNAENSSDPNAPAGESQLDEARRSERVNFEAPVQDGESSQSAAKSSALLLAASIIALIAGLVFAKKYKNGR